MERRYRAWRGGVLARALGDLTATVVDAGPARSREDNDLRALTKGNSDSALTRGWGDGGRDQELRRTTSFDGLRASANGDLFAGVRDLGQSRSVKAKDLMWAIQTLKNLCSSARRVMDGEGGFGIHNNQPCRGRGAT
jgi:hypothetical protein